MDLGIVVKRMELSCRYIQGDNNLNNFENSLASIRFDGSCENSASKGYLSTGLTLLEPSTCSEYLISQEPVTTTQTENSFTAETKDYLFCAIWIDETRNKNIQQATEVAYTYLLNETKTRGFEYLVRVWNYFARINEEENGLERYRQFCIGRFNAFTTAGIAEADFPSACALGHHGGDLIIYLLASKQAPLHFENPVQASAYHYPAEYGPRSPSFARASLLDLGDKGAKLFLSGTASVIGFVTQHPHELEAQIQVTLQNIDRLLAHISNNINNENTPDHILSLEVLKVYVRRADDLEAVKSKVDKHFQSSAIVYLLADICRADLTLEIDGVWNLAQ